MYNIPDTEMSSVIKRIYKKCVKKGECVIWNYDTEYPQISYKHVKYSVKPLLYSQHYPSYEQKSNFRLYNSK